jgi:hypothetical protein
MPRTRENTAYAQRLIKEYNHARTLLHKYLKKRHDPSDVTAMIATVIENMTAKQSKIIGYTLNTAFKEGTKEGNKIIRTARVTASTASIGFDMTKVADTHLNKITGDTIGRIGKYNQVVTNQLFHQYQSLLADNKLVNTLNRSGWSPSIETSLVKRGIAPEVISQLKGQTTTKKIVSILETHGIRGGMNPRQVSRLLQPQVTNYFGPKGVLIDNVGKFKKVLKVDADGNFKYVKQAVTRPYRATPKTYSNLVARSSMIQAHHEGRYQSLQKTGLVDYYISKSVLDANTCNLCATMHGQRVSHSEGPLYHPSGACELKPIWKKDSGIQNKDPSVYEKQRDQHFWKQHQLAEYNKKMPRGAKLKFHSMLPKEALTDMPGKDTMRTIRYNALGKPGAIKPRVVRPKVTKVKPVSEHVKKKIEEKVKEQPKEKVKEKVKETLKEKVQKIVKKKAEKKIVKKETVAEMKRKEREIADELWEKTAKDGNEHLKITNSKTICADGNKHGVKVKSPPTPHKKQHTHPNWDAPLSGGDFGNFFVNPSLMQSSASTSKNIYMIKRRVDTIVPKEGYNALMAKHDNLALAINKKAVKEFKRKTGRTPQGAQVRNILHDSFIKANEEFAKEYKLDYIVFKR